MDQANEAQAAQPGNWKNEYERVRSRSPLDQREREAFLTRRAKLLFGSYRRDDASDPDNYVGAVVLVLSEYPNGIVEFATDPRTGLQAQEKFRAFMPNSGEVKAFCDEEISRAQRMAQPATTFSRCGYAPLPRYPGSRANVFVHAGAPQYPALLERSQSPGEDECEWRPSDDHRDGIWVSPAWIDSYGIAKWRRPPASVALAQGPDIVTREYIAAGLEPPPLGADRVSLTMLLRRGYTIADVDGKRELLSPATR